MKQILVALLFVISQSAVLAQKNAVIDDLLSSYEKINQFSGSVLVAEKGKVIFEKSYGYRNAVKQEKNTNNSKYRIYSTTKVFTTIVILKLQEQGKLSLEDKLSTYFPSYTKGDSITIRNMLSHTSGIPETEEANNEEELLKQLLTKPLDFSVDTKWSYCNTNFYLLGYIIQKVTGQPYEEVIAEMILKPFQMTHSGFHFNDLKDENKALGYEFIVGENSNEALRFKSDHPYAAGAMYSTVEDLYKFSEAFYTGKIIDTNLVKYMCNPYLEEHYGLGQEVYSIQNSDKILVGHGGLGPGYRCRFIRDCEQEVAIILLANSEMVPIDKIAEEITGIIYRKSKKKIEVGKNVTHSDLHQIEGIYSSKEGTFYVRIVDGMVVFNGSILPRVPLIPVTKTLYQLVDSFTFNFKTDQFGKIKAITVTNLRGVKTAEKISDTFPWGIIGTATTSGWDGKDIVMQTKKGNPHLYYLKNYPLNAGELRFRLNNDWNNSLALNNDDKNLCYDGYNIKIKETGKYDIVLDMTIASKPRFSMKKL
ncbi:serine hydrolase [Flectobacillus longus]|uniref:serine hydrolase n=1 Tax=Flectobacillus longus TaxID=2984207 RepID=UPI0024B73F07|nr:serine hydrolase [Flectobacillus longus]MDI9882491.1 serine hydrolase [Flectobacillus longus]